MITSTCNQYKQLMINYILNLKMICLVCHIHVTIFWYYVSLKSGEYFTLKAHPNQTKQNPGATGCHSHRSAQHRQRTRESGGMEPPSF